jgi:hypothetical protein
MSRDPQGMLSVGEEQTKNHLELIFHFLRRCLSVNRNSSSSLDGVSIMSVVIAIFEDMQGLIDNYFDLLMAIVVEELLYFSGKKKIHKNMVAICLQAVAMAIAYNSQLAFKWLETQG